MVPEEMTLGNNVWRAMGRKLNTNEISSSEAPKKKKTPGSTDSDEACPSNYQPHFQPSFFHCL